MTFRFLDDFDYIPGYEVALLIDRHVPADPAKGWVPAYKYHVVLHDSSTIVGRIDLRIGDQESLYYAGHIGFGIHEAYRGRHFAAKACQLLKPLALAHEMTPLSITCSPTNEPSRKTCEYIGATLKSIVTLPAHHGLFQCGERQVYVYEWILVP